VLVFSAFHHGAMLSLQGDIHHWTPVLDHFDAFLEEAAARSDVQLLSRGPGLQPEQPFPADTIEAVLGVTCALLENCSNARAVYNSSEVSSTKACMHVWLAHAAADAGRHTAAQRAQRAMPTSLSADASLLVPAASD
jgi:hypothetical protein